MATTGGVTAAAGAPACQAPATGVPAAAADPKQQDAHSEPDSHVFHHDADRPTALLENQRRVIMVAVDASDNSVNAFNWAMTNFLRQETDFVVLVNVRLPSNVPGPYGKHHFHRRNPRPVNSPVNDWGTSRRSARMEDHSRRVSHNLLLKYGEILKSRGFDCKAIAIRGDPRYDIVRKAIDLKVEAVVMGSRGMGAIKRTLLGSVSDYCVHHLPIPVIIVKMQEKVTALPER